MIVKQIPGRAFERNAALVRARNAGSLVDYIRSPQKDGREKAYQVAYMLGEKLGDVANARLFHVGGKGFISESLEGQRAEMLAVAQAAKRSTKPIDHWLLSWQRGEHPTPEQVDAAVDLFLECLGLQGQPCIYACHGDTDNRHVHMAVSRYNPVTERMIEINDGWTREAAHRAVASIVHRFGWQAEVDARYRVSQDGVVVPTEIGGEKIDAFRKRTGSKGPTPGAAAFENRTGFRSAQSIAQREAVPLIEGAQSWGDLHAELAVAGMCYDVRGTNGATITVRGEGIGASKVNLAITRKRLEERFGPFERRRDAVTIIERDLLADRLPEAFRAEEYYEECERWRRRQRGRGDRLSARAPSTPDTEREQPAKSADQAGPFKSLPPDLEHWYYERRERAFAERWRRRKRVEALPRLAGAERGAVAPVARIGEYLAYRCSDGIRYARGVDQPTAFIDRGPRVDVVVQDDAALLAALQLATRKFGDAVSVQGSPEFRRRIREVAEANGLAQVLSDPDLRSTVNRKAVVSSDMTVSARTIADSRPSSQHHPDRIAEKAHSSASVGRPATSSTAIVRQAAKYLASLKEASPGKVVSTQMQRSEGEDRGKITGEAPRGLTGIARAEEAPVTPVLSLAHLQTDLSQVRHDDDTRRDLDNGSSTIPLEDGVSEDGIDLATLMRVRDQNRGRD